MKITNSLNLPKPFVSAIEREYSYKPKRYSVTSILKGTREAILQRRHDSEIETDLADMAWLIFGSAVHSILENSKETEEQLKESHIEVDMPNGYTLSGIFDLYDDSTGTVTDYKTASVWKVIYNEWDDYKKQTMLYCWLLRQIGFDARRGEIVAILKDHSKTKAETEANYPNYPIYRIGWDFTDSDFDNLEEWLFAKFREIEAAEQLPDEELPLCTSEERWAKPDKWAAKKATSKRATKIFDDEAAAYEYAGANGLVIEYRPGEDVKCAKYCSVCEFCNQYKERCSIGR